MNAGKLWAVCVLFFATMTLGCASGSVILTGEARTPVPSDKVKLYLEAPRSYDVIGIVSASSDAGFTEQGSQDYAIRELKEQAGKVGANGVLLTSTGERITGFWKSYPISAKTVQGRAIYVKTE